MRAAVERDSATAKDAWGNPVAAVMTSTGDPLACFIWSVKSEDLTDGAKSAGVELFHGLFALGVDLRPGDEIAAITDRQGAVILPGRMLVLGPVQRRHTHVEATLRRISGGSIG